ncbi:MAG: hypothetical protein IID30_12995 [Planctomycetes bacterium]|nr:hypothetical protein [Planctomycetota bacterium]
MSEKIPPIVAPPIVPPPVIEARRREVRLDEDGRIAEHVDCRGCGYNLQGLTPQGKCPECSMPIERSIHGDELRFSDPAWVGSLARGVQFILIGFFTFLGFYILYFIGIIFMSISGAATTATTTSGTGGTTNVTVTAMPFTLTPFIIAASSLLTLPLFIIIYGVWKLTTPDPGLVEREAPNSVRNVARWCILVTVVSIPLAMMGMNTNTFAAVPSAVSPAMQIAQYTGMGLGVVTLVGYIAGLLYLSRLGNRIPNPSLTLHSKIVMWGYGSTQIVNTVLGTIFLFLMPGYMASMTSGTPSFPPGFWILSLGSSLIGCFGFVFLIWMIVLLFRFFYAFRKETGTAKANWNLA